MNFNLDIVYKMSSCLLLLRKLLFALQAFMNDAFKYAKDVFLS